MCFGLSVNDAALQDFVFFLNFPEKKALCSPSAGHYTTGDNR
jgi:hypothetical protein